MAKDLKYGDVSTERGSIGPEEPVFVFRAQDELLPTVLAYYRSLCVGAGSPERHLDAITDAKHAIETWQLANPTKVPESIGYESPR